MRIVTALVPFLLLAPPLAAQMPEPAVSCDNVRVALPPELSAWSDQTPVSAGVKPGDGATVTIGHAALVSLHPDKHLALSPAPRKPAGDATSGGTLSLVVTTPGTYRMALGGPVWVDVVRAGKPLPSVAHGHGPKCSGVRKMVDFKLTPGNYVIQLSGSADENVAMLVAKRA